MTQPGYEPCMCGMLWKRDGSENYMLDEHNCNEISWEAIDSGDLEP